MVCRPILQLFLIGISLFILRWYLRRKRQKNTIGIFHLYCSSCGGGERVLWHAVRCLLKKYPKYSIYIYTQAGVHHDSLQILLKARNLFKIDLISDRRTLERLEFIPLSLSPLVEAKRYPFMTLLLQNLMSAVVAFQAAYNLVPEVYIETIGFTYTLPVFKLFGCTVATYVHYPTISSDMIKNVEISTHSSFNNREIFVRSELLRKMKLAYYWMLAVLYGFAGRRADLVVVNSSWTRDHIRELWQTDVKVVYPPCDIESFRSLSGDKLSRKEGKNLKIISIAQFRPEKNHEQQIEAFDMFMNRTNSDAELILYGGCRGEEDHKRVDYLRDLICRLDLGSRVSIVVNAPFGKLLEGVSEADVALHTMKNEHFGIVLLEFMAAGLITLAHNSGGPRMDIIDDKINGFLCNDVEDFANRLAQISEMGRDERDIIGLNAKSKAGKFDVRVFETSFLSIFEKLPFG